MTDHIPPGSNWNFTGRPVDPQAVVNALYRNVPHDEPTPTDWTVGPDGRSNTSPEYLALQDEITELIRSSASALIYGNARGVAGLILARLSHVHGMRPGPRHE
jgi:hypothetical protein